jgi:voltage-gated sodium channel
MNLNKIAHANWFSNLITVIIIINAILIGVQTEVHSVIINNTQHAILGIFILEILIRWFGRNSTKEYVNNYWNWFDIIIVGIALIPPSIFSDGAALSALRVARVFRVIRMFKAFPELQLLVKVLLRSFQSVYFACLLLLVFMYMYSVIGVTLFRGLTTVETAHSNNVDPFGNVLEAFFSLFRVTTGEDWTDLRYDLMSQTSSLLMNNYFISWYVLSAFLLINIVFGAIINNYEVVYAEEAQNSAKDKEDISFEDPLPERIGALEEKIDLLLAKIHSEESSKS